MVVVVMVVDKDTAPSAAPGALSVGVPNGWNADDSTFGILFRCLKIRQIIRSKRRSSSSTAPHSVRDCSLSRISLSRYVVWNRPICEYSRMRRTLPQRGSTFFQWS